ncbi:hypothetical protein MLD38_038203 [Melastoma candidum]|uniref:Uncharacterized protein n=1 Tax=Melastoma candidum TaxID=119954 RepID=A0ACB9KYG8_9MYRT|nr:hypothetical protein MLD38_038203 [Melastoma candidum]
MARVCPDADTRKKRMINDLLMGRDLAVQLQGIMSDPHPSSADKAREILGKILGSFSRGISTVSSFEGDGEGSLSGESGESKSRHGEKGRGCYKRRKGSQSWTAVNSTTEDGYSWRKYGQKEILNSKFPRCYYRCTRKHDQGCKATKQVQRMEEDPNMYQITYIGHHTCREISRAPQMIPDSDPWELNSPDARTEFKPQIHRQDHGPVNPFPCVKDEHREDSGSDLTDCPSGFSQDWPGFPTISSMVGDDLPIWSFSDDGFQSLSNTSFLDRCIGFDGELEFDGSDLL